jgi:hypothetical protein
VLEFALGVGEADVDVIHAFVLDRFQNVFDAHLWCPSRDGIGEF